MTDNTYPNPVLGVEKEDRKVVTVDIIKDDWLLLKGCDIEHGSLTATFNILVNTLANECRKRGIHDFSKSQEFRQLVQSVGFIPADSCVVTREELETLREQSTEYQRILAGATGGLRDRPAKGTPRQSTGRNVGRRTKGKGDKISSTKDSTGVQSGGGTGKPSGEEQAVSGEVGETS